MTIRSVFQEIRVEIWKDALSCNVEESFAVELEKRASERIMRLRALHTAVGDVWYGEAVGGVVRVGLEVDPQVACACSERQRSRR